MALIRRFFQWWLGQLRALLPFSIGKDSGNWLDVTLDAERVCAAFSDHREALLMDVARAQESTVQAELARIAATLSQTQARCRVWVDESEVLRREIELPMAAEENLREVLAFEMARKTPFRAQDVYFDAQITARDPARRMLTLQLDVVPRRALQVVTSALGDWSLQAISSAGAARRAQHNKQAVFAFRAEAFTQRSFSGLNLTLGVAVLLLAAVCAWLPIDAQRRAHEQLKSQAQGALVDATEAMVLRDEFDAVLSASATLAEAQAARPSMVEVLEALTRALPDNTFLSRLQIDEGEIDLHGTSQAASELIAILDRLPLLEGVRFASPVTRDAASGGERFHIVGNLLAPVRAKAPPSRAES